jgi:TRAP-type C4-dicarboxylate transport system substrate-binding protein
MKRTLFVVTLALVGLAGASHAQAPVDMRFSHFVPTTHRSVAGVQMWADSLQKATGGKLQVRIFPSEQLGKAKDQYDMVRDGIADAAWVVPGYTPGRFPVVSLLELPFMTRDADAGSAVFDAWYRPLAAREMPEVRYCLGFLQDPGVLHTSRKVEGPQDLKGLKLRSPTAPVSEFFQQIGASSVAIPAPQVREAVERGTIDGAGFGWQTAVSLGITKATRYHLDAPLYTVPVAYLINQGFYERQSGEVRQAIDAHCNGSWARRIGADWAAWEAGGRAHVMAEPGHVLTKLSPAQLKAWRDAAGPLLDHWHATVARKGLDSQSLLKSLRDELVRAGAGY